MALYVPMLMLMIFALGFFFDWIEITLIMLPIVAPIVAIMDLGDHVARTDMIYWFAVLMAVNLQTSFLRTGPMVTRSVVAVLILVTIVHILSNDQSSLTHLLKRYHQ